MKEAIEPARKKTNRRFPEATMGHRIPGPGVSHPGVHKGFSGLRV